MHGIDMRTLALVATIVSAIVALTFGVTTLNFQERRRPTAWWALGFLLYAGGFLLVYFQGRAPAFFTFIVGNLLLMANGAILCWGVDAFNGRPVRPLAGIGIVGAGLLLFLVFFYLRPSFPARIIVFSTVRISLDILVFGRILSHVPRSLRAQGLIAASFFCLDGLIGVTRIVVSAVGAAGSTLFAPTVSSVPAFIGGFVVPICLALSLLSLVARRTQEEQAKTIAELAVALGRVKSLSGLLPICASCKRIRDEKGEWHAVDRYVRDRSEASFSHDLCPDCAARQGRP
jgi:hypothetical protein